MAPRERLQTLGCAQRRRELGAEIAFALVRRANIGKNDLLKIDIEGTMADEPQWRHAQPFAEDLGHSAVAAWRGRTNIRPMSAQAAVAEEFAVVECRPYHVHVRQMAAAEIGVVVDKNITVMHV